LEGGLCEGLIKQFGRGGVGDGLPVSQAVESCPERLHYKLIYFKPAIIQLSTTSKCTIVAVLPSVTIPIKLGREMLQVDL
jgi:hypothetical protein